MNTVQRWSSGYKSYFISLDTKPYEVCDLLNELKCTALYITK